ncbi:MAG: OmpH family outer membrane protein [Bryobacteraceae bacterium]
MKLFLPVLSMLAAVVCGWGQTAVKTPPKVALVNIQDAIIGTADGQAAAKRLEDEFGPRKAKLDQEKQSIDAIQKRMDEDKTLSGDDRQKISKDLADKTVLFNVETDQDDSDLEQAQNKVLREIGKKMVAVIVEVASASGYAMVFDVSTSRAPLLYAENATDITSDVIRVYDKRAAAQ